MLVISLLLAAAPLDADRCRGIAGYAEFRAAIEDALARRDGKALDALFAPQGAMRVDGLSRHSLVDDQASLVRVWRPLADIMARGCAVHGERLLLPGLALMAETGEVDTGVWVITKRTPMRSRPSAGAPRRGWLRAGAHIAPTLYGSPGEFSGFIWRGKPAFVPSEALRSPHDLRLELERIDGRWRIRSFGDGV